MAVFGIILALNKTCNGALHGMKDIAREETVSIIEAMITFYGIDIAPPKWSLYCVAGLLLRRNAKSVLIYDAEQGLRDGLFPVKAVFAGIACRSAIAKCRLNCEQRNKEP